MRGLLPMGTLVMSWIVVCAGLSAGLALGYDATSESETEIYIDGDDLVIGDERSNVSMDGRDEPEPAYLEDVEELPEIPSPVPARFENSIQEQTNATVDWIYWNSLELTITIADAAATWSYHNRWWLPAWVARSFLNVLAFGPLAGMLLIYSHRLRGVFG
jgi:hypothetical protein